MYCYKCGREIEEATHVCPYCGAKQTVHTAGPQAGRSQYNLLCVIGFAVSCISLFIDYRGLFAVVGIILSIIGMMNARQKNEKGKVFAILGIVIGAVEIVLTVIWISKIYDYAMGMIEGTA